MNRAGFTVQVLRSGSATRVGGGFVVTGRHIVTCAHVVNTALGRDQRAQEEPGPDTRIQVEFPMLADSDRAPVRSCSVRAWAPPPLSGAFGADLAGLELAPADFPPGAGPARLVEPVSMQGTAVDLFGYPAKPARREGGAWSRHVCRGTVGGGAIQLDIGRESAIWAQPGYSGSPAVVADSAGDAVIGMLTVASRDGRSGDAYALPISALAREWPEVLGRLTMPACPYPGLLTFTAGDARAGLFVGREQETAELRRMIGQHGLLMLIGPSGVGKSSLVTAGLNYHLEREGWAVRSFRPTAMPLDDLARVFLAIERADGSITTRDLARCVRRLRSQGLSDAGSQLARAIGRSVLVFVDPLEEVLEEETCWPRVRQEFLELILSVRDALDAQFRLLCALRTDFMNQLLEYPDAGNRLQGRSFMLSPMDSKRLERIITEPALVRGVTYDRGLARLIAADAGTGASLPLLGFALRELWPHQNQRRISLESYQDLGGVSGVLGRYADAVYHELLEQFTEYQIRNVMLMFVRTGTALTRRPVARSVLTPDQWAVVSQLLGKRLIVSRREEPRGDVLEIAHEALLTKWDRLSEWIASDRTFLDWRSRMRNLLDADLLPETELAEARGWMADRPADIDADIQAMISRSQTHYEQQVRHLEEARDRAERAALKSDALRLASQSEQAHLSSSSAGISLAVESLLKIPTVQGDLALRRALAHAARPTILLKGEAEVNAAAISADGSLIAVAGEDGITYVFTSWGERCCRHKQIGSLRSIAISGDGKWVVTAARNGSAHIFNSSTGGERCRLPHDDAVNAVAFSPNGRLVATGCEDGTTRVFRASNGQELRHWAHAGAVKAVAFSPDGRLVVTASDDGTARVFALRTKEEQCRLAHGGPVNAVDVSPDGRLAVTASDDGTARVFELGSGAVQALFSQDDPVKSVAFSHDARLVATAGGKPRKGTLTVFDVSSGQPLASWTDRGLLNQVAFSYDDMLVTTAGTSGAVRVFETAGGHERSGLRHDRPVRAVACSPRTRQIVTASADHSARLFNPTPGPERSCVTGKGPVHRIDFSRDGHLAAMASDDGEVRVFDPGTGVVRHHLVHDGPATSVDFSPDGRLLATASDDGSARLFDAETGAEVGRIDHDGPVRAVAFNQEGDCVATASGDRTVGTLQIPTGHQRARIPHLGPVTSVAFSSNGAWIATANGGRGGETAAQVFAVASGELTSRLVHDGWVNAVALSPDGEWVATASDDGTARVFDPATGNERSRLVHDAPVNAVAFSPDGQWLGTACHDGSARILPVGLDALLTAARERIVRPLTSAERKRYSAAGPDDPATDASSQGQEAAHVETRLPRFNWYRLGDYTVVEFRGELDIFATPVMSECFMTLVNNGRYRLIADLEAVEFIDSGGLNAIMGGLKRVRAHDGTMLIACRQERIRKIFRITGLQEIFGIYDTPAEAAGAS